MVFEAGRVLFELVLAVLSFFVLGAFLLSWGWVPQAWSLGGCGLWATSTSNSGLGQPGGPLAEQAGLAAGLWLRQAFGVFFLFGFGGRHLQPPRFLGTHTSMCVAGVNRGKELLFE